MTHADDDDYVYDGLESHLEDAQKGCWTRFSQMTLGMSSRDNIMTDWLHVHLSKNSAI